MVILIFIDKNIPILFNCAEEWKTFAWAYWKFEKDNYLIGTDEIISYKNQN